MDPGSTAWNNLRERIASTELASSDATNTARQIQLAQGAMFAELDVVQTRLMARECGLSPATALRRREMHLRLCDDTNGVRRLLEANDDLAVSFDTIVAVFTADDPQETLRKLIVDARGAQLGRVTRNNVRRELGKATSSAPAPEVGERIVRDTVFVDQLVADPAAVKALFEALGRKDTARAHAAARTRLAKERDARRDGAAPAPLVSTEEVTAQTLAAEVFWGKVMEAPRNTVVTELAHLAAGQMRNLAGRLDAWASGETDALSEDDFAAGIEAFMSGGQA